MVWFKVDDGFHSHPKAAAASLAALGLWAMAGSWAGKHTTDGDVPEHMIPSLSRGATELADELVKCGLWRRTRTGYRFHQWAADGDGTKRNPTKKEVEEERRKKAEAGRKGGKVSGARRAASANPRSKPEARAEASAEAGATDVLQPPTRPDPPPSKEGGEGASRRADARGATAPPPQTGSPPAPPMFGNSRAATPPADLIAATKAKLRDASRKVKSSGDARRAGAFEALMAIPTTNQTTDADQAPEPPTDPETTHS